MEVTGQVVGSSLCCLLPVGRLIRTHIHAHILLIKSNFSSHSQLSEAGITLVSTQYIVIFRHKDRK